MRKSKLVDGTPFFGIKIDHFVTKTVFVKALATHSWINMEPFDLKISKTTAIQRLKGGLYHNGNSGIDTDSWTGAEDAFMDVFDEAIGKATEWIEKNYPYLK